MPIARTLTRAVLLLEFECRVRAFQIYRKRPAGGPACTSYDSTFVLPRALGFGRWSRSPGTPNPQQHGAVLTGVQLRGAYCFQIEGQQAPRPCCVTSQAWLQILPKPCQETPVIPLYRMTESLVGSLKRQ